MRNDVVGKKENKGGGIMNEQYVSVSRLQEILECGYKAAVRIGKEADAEYKIGRLVRYDLERIRIYIEQECKR